MLGKEWYFKVNNNRIHPVLFNKSILCPRLTNGWNELRNAYQLPECHKLEVEFMGDDFFNVQIHNSNINSNIIPPFHSLSTAPRFHREYQIQLSKTSYFSKFLVFT
jgi:hypothetical protein